MKYKQKLNILIILSLLVASTAGCHPGFDNFSKSSEQSEIKPEWFFSGSWTGYQMVMDRNRNIRENAIIQRKCARPGELSGSCIDIIAYQVNKKRVERQILWTQQFVNSNQFNLKIKSDSMELSGINSISRDTIILNGDMSVPESSSMMDASVRYFRQPGVDNIAVESSIYSRFGITMGAVETFWIRNPDMNK